MKFELSVREQKHVDPVALTAMTCCFEMFIIYGALFVTCFTQFEVCVNFYSEVVSYFQCKFMTLTFDLFTSNLFHQLFLTTHHFPQGWKKPRFLDKVFRLLGFYGF